MTISEAVIAVLKDQPNGLFLKEIYQHIVERGLYTFNSENPVNMVRNAVSRHCLGMDFKSARPQKYFRLADSGKFCLSEGAQKPSQQLNLAPVVSALNESLILTPVDSSNPLPKTSLTPATAEEHPSLPSRRRRASQKSEQERAVLPVIAKGLPALASKEDEEALRAHRLFDELKQKHEEHTRAVKQLVLERLHRLDAGAFERFSRRLLTEYGFKEVRLTNPRPGRDGGVDGSGRLQIGLVQLDVAFQCKRWTKTQIGRNEIDKFRGAIQGRFEQGYFFTTSGFTAEAKEASFRKGAAPIILVDGPSIVELMFEKGFGVQRQELTLFTQALDEVLES